jgi:branched-chain amino acid transport system permease protein
MSVASLERPIAPAMQQRSKLAYAIPVLGFGFIAAFPFLVGPHYAILMFSAMGFAICLLGLNLLFGYTGLLSFGHAMFVAIGAYTAAYLTAAKILHLEVILLTAAAVAVVAAVPIGLLCIRYVRIYFSMLTLAFSMLLYSFLYKFYPITGGDEGLRIKMPVPLLLDVSKLDTVGILTGPLYYYVLAMLIALTFLMWRITASPFGLGLRAIRDNQQKAEYLGVNIQRNRLIVFVLSGVYGALGGVIVSIPVGLADPTLAYWVQSGNLVFMLLLGGYTNFFGPILGAAVFTFFQDQLMSYTEYWRLTFGIVLAVIVIFFPNGLMGIVDPRRRWSA